MITLSNNFHQTTTLVRPKDGKLSARQLQAACKRLCGITTCQCGSIRGPQFDEVLGRFELELQNDGSYKVISDHPDYF